MFSLPLDLTIPPAHPSTLPPALSDEPLEAVGSSGQGATSLCSWRSLKDLYLGGSFLEVEQDSSLLFGGLPLLTEPVLPALEEGIGYLNDCNPPTGERSQRVV